MNTWKSILGYEAGNTRNSLERKYKKIAVRTHPNKNRGNPNATAAFQRLQSAWNNAKRAMERKRSRSPNSGAQAPKRSTPSTSYEEWCRMKKAEREREERYVAEMTRRAAQHAAERAAKHERWWAEEVARGKAERARHNAELAAKRAAGFTNANLEYEARWGKDFPTPANLRVFQEQKRVEKERFDKEMDDAYKRNAERERVEAIRLHAENKAVNAARKRARENAKERGVKEHDLEREYRLAAAAHKRAVKASADGKKNNFSNKTLVRHRQLAFTKKRLQAARMAMLKRWA